MDDDWYFDGVLLARDESRPGSARARPASWFAVRNGIGRDCGEVERAAVGRAVTQGLVLSRSLWSGPAR